MASEANPRENQLVQRYDPRIQADLALMALKGALERFEPGAKRKFAEGSSDLVKRVAERLAEVNRIAQVEHTDRQDHQAALGDYGQPPAVPNCQNLETLVFNQ